MRRGVGGMKILHYFLGFPPYRSGGLTKYATDLMEAQRDNGDVVMALWPGRLKFFGKTIKIKKNNEFNSILNYEIINPLPVSLDEGIKIIDKYMVSGNEEIFSCFLEECKPDIIHIHTLMGLHKEFISAAKKKGIKTVFTAHDCFPTCTKVTRFRFDSACDSADCSKCIKCNLSALPLYKIYVMQSRLYRRIKSFVFIKIIRKRHRVNFFALDREPVLPAKTNISELANAYEQLRNFYMAILDDIDFIHYNSSVTQTIYSKFIKKDNSNIISITHKDIKDRRKDRTIEKHDTLRIGFLAPATPYKGFTVLKKAVDYIWNNQLMDVELKVFSNVRDIEPYMTVQDEGYKYEQLEDILHNIDVVIAPSICYDTFGFTVLEALSNGVPVIVSDNVGAKDIIADGGIIVATNSVEDLVKAILSLDFENLILLDENIKKKVKIKTWDQLLVENYDIYNSLMESGDFNS